MPLLRLVSDPAQGVRDAAGLKHVFAESFPAWAGAAALPCGFLPLTGWPGKHGSRFRVISHATRQVTSLMEYCEVKKFYPWKLYSNTMYFILNVHFSYSCLCILFNYAVNVCVFHRFMWSVQLHTSIKAQSRYKILDWLTLIAKLWRVLMLGTNNPR